MKEILQLLIKFMKNVFHDTPGENCSFFGSGNI